MGFYWFGKGLEFQQFLLDYKLALPKIQYIGSIEVFTLPRLIKTHERCFSGGGGKSDHIIYFEGH